MKQDKRRIFIFANRTDPDSVGGLTSLINDHFKNDGKTEPDQEVILVGWSGKRVQTEEERTTGRLKKDGITYLTVDMTEDEYDKAYCGFQNRYLWPVSHKMIGNAAYVEGGIEANEKINGVYADLAIKQGELNQDDIILVQDYQLYPLGKILEDKGFDNKKAFYLHTPMPSKRTIVRAEARGLNTNDDFQKTVVKNMSAYDYIGFQRPRDAAKFTSHLDRPLDKNFFQPYQIHNVEGHNISFNPVGINVERFQEMAIVNKDHELVRRHVAQSAKPDQTTVIFAGRYDYSKGHINYLNGLEALLHMAPEEARKIRTVFIGGPTRGDIPEYAEYNSYLQAKIASVNFAFQQAGFTTPDEPAITQTKNIPRDALAGMMGAAEEITKAGGRQVAMFPSIMDGQNLCVHEAIAASPYNIVVSSVGSGCVDVIGEANLGVVLYNNNEPEPAAVMEMASRLMLLNATDMQLNVEKSKAALYNMTQLYPGSNWMKYMLDPFKLN